MSTNAAVTVLAWSRLCDVGNAMRRELAQTFRRRGLPPPEWSDVLGAIARRSSPRQREIQTALGIEQYHLSRLLDRMVRRGLVCRLPCPADRRTHALALTDAGRAMHEAMLAAQVEAGAGALGERLDESERLAFAGLLAKLA